LPKNVEGMVKRQKEGGKTRDLGIYWIESFRKTNFARKDRRVKSGKCCKMPWRGEFFYSQRGGGEKMHGSCPKGLKGVPGAGLESNPTRSTG